MNDPAARPSNPADIDRVSAASPGDAAGAAGMVPEPAAAPVSAPESPPTSAPTSKPAPGPGSSGSIIRRLGPVGVLAAVWAAMPAVMGLLLIFRYLDDVSAWLLARGPMGLLIFIAGFIVTAGLGLLPTYAQAVLAGWVFGIAVGIPAALAGFTGAALIGYAVTRAVSGQRVERLVADHPRASVVRSALIGRGFWPTLGVVSLVRLPPNSPFSLTNLLLAGSGVPLGTYLIGTVIGMTPRTALVAMLAAGAAASGSEDIVAFARERNLWVVVAAVVGTLVVLGVIGRVANSALERFAGPGDGAGNP